MLTGKSTATWRSKGHEAAWCNSERPWWIKSVGIEKLIRSSVPCCYNTLQVNPNECKESHPYCCILGNTRTITHEFPWAHLPCLIHNSHTTQTIMYAYLKTCCQLNVHLVVHHRAVGTKTHQCPGHPHNRFWDFGGWKSAAKIITSHLSIKIWLVHRRTKTPNVLTFKSYDVICIHMPYSPKLGFNQVFRTRFTQMASCNPFWHLVIFARPRLAAASKGVKPEPQHWSF